MAQEMETTAEALSALQAAMVEKKQLEGSDPNKAVETAFANFMASAGEPVTWVEIREIVNDLRKTNNGELPKFEDTIDRLCFNKASVKAEDVKESLDVSTGSNNDSEDNEAHAGPEEGSQLTPANLSKEQMVRIAKGIKETYNIRASDDMSEFKFVMGSMALLWLVVVALAISGHFFPQNATRKERR